MVRSLCPVSVAAFAAISCNACFFPLTFRAGMIAFGGGGAPAERASIRQRRRDLHPQRPRRARIRGAGQCRHGRDQRADPGAGRVPHASAAGSAAAFGDTNQHGMEGVKFWTKVKTITQRWPDGWRRCDGALTPSSSRRWGDGGLREPAPGTADRKYAPMQERAAMTNQFDLTDDQRADPGDGAAIHRRRDHAASRPSGTRSTSSRATRSAQAAELGFGVDLRVRGERRDRRSAGSRRR